MSHKEPLKIIRAHEFPVVMLAPPTAPIDDPQEAFIELNMALLKLCRVVFA